LCAVLEGGMGLVVTVRSLLESAVEWGVVDWAQARALLEKLVGDIEDENSR
jgi:hypothetical protein